MADAQILPFPVSAAPNTWTLPAALTLMLKSATAVFDGTAAATPFLPVIEIISDSGHLVARVPTDTVVAAGGSAEVTFAPFLRAPAFPAPVAGTPAPSTFLYDYTLPADAASIDTLTDGPFAGLLSGAFYLLELWLYVRTDEVTTASPILMQVNGDTGAHYDRIFLSGFTNVATPAGTTSVTVQTGLTQWQPAAVCGASSTASYFSVVKVSIPSYSGTQGFKTGEATHAHPNAVAGVDPAGLLIAPQTLGWRSTAAISRYHVAPLNVGVKLKAGTRLLIYGR